MALLRRTAAAAVLLGVSAAPALACGVGEVCALDEGDYRIVLPEEGAAPAAGWPAVVFFHGWGSAAANVAGNDGLTGAFTRRGYAVIAPDGLVPPGGRNSGWSIPGLRLGGRDDVAFTEALVADAVARFDLDADRLIAAGFSLGGSFVWTLACERPELFAAYLPVAGAFWEPLPETCAGPLDLWHIHGFTDTVVPLEGRPVADGQFVQGDVYAGLDVLRRANGCTSDLPDSFDMDGPFDCRRWDGCPTGRSLSFCLHPGGHSLPAGWTDTALDWAEGLQALR